MKSSVKTEVVKSSIVMEFSMAEAKILKNIVRINVTVPDLIHNGRSTDTPKEDITAFMNEIFDAIVEANE